MLAFVAAAGAELASGAPVAAQLKEAPLFIGLTFLVFTIASLVCPTSAPFNPLSSLGFFRYHMPIGGMREEPNASPTAVACSIF